MIAHVFNSSIVSGPEILVLPSLLQLGEPIRVIFLMETRLAKKSRCPVDYARSLGHQVETVEVRSRWDTGAFAELRGILDRLKPRIAHAHDVKASLYLHQARKLRTGLGAALVSTHHGAAYRRGKIRLYEEYYVRRVLPFYDLVLSTCTQDRTSMANRGVAEEKISVHLNGADRTRVPKETRDLIAEKIRSEWRARNPNLPGPEEAVFLGCVARLSSEKRHDRMLKVLQFLREFGPRGKKPILVCFGIGAEEARLKKMAQNCGVENAVFWMGYSDTIGEEMAGFDALLCLSDGEGIPISLLEAGWGGTPVVATAVGGIPDLISSSSVGYLVKKEDSNERIASLLSTLLKDPPGMRRVGEAFQARVESEFSQSKWVERLQQAYARVCSPPVTPRV